MHLQDISLSQAIEGYFIAAHARRLSPGTLSLYDLMFRRLEAHLGTDPPLREISPADIRQFLNGLNGLSAGSLTTVHTALSALWTWAVKEGVVEQHVVRQVQRPRGEKRVIVPYSKQDVKSMLAACDRSAGYSRPGQRRCDHARPTALRDRAILMLLLDTGLRASELCGLQVRDVDFRNDRLTVMGKGAKERVLPFDGRTAQALWRYLATRDSQRGRDFLFRTRTGRAVHPKGLLQIIKGIGRRAGVTGVTVHRFRHTFAITFLRNGGHVFALQRMLGHSTMQMVKHYLALAEMDVEQAHRNASPVGNWLL